MEFIESVKLFNEIAGTKEEFNKRKAALYVGLILEEVAEMLESIKSENVVYIQEMEGKISSLANSFKDGSYDYAMKTIDRTEFLDAAVDIMVVAAGAGISIGGDIQGAANEVCESNLSKFKTESGTLEVIKDENGKIKKGPLYFSPSLEKFVK